MRVLAKRRQQHVTFREFLRGVRIQNANTQQIIPMEPWPYLMDAAERWASGESSIVLKARQLGFSWLAAAYACWVARRPNSRILAISQGDEYAKELLAKVRFVNENHADGPMPLSTDNTEQMGFAGGGTIMALPSTRNAGRGFNASLVIVDEAAFHPWAAANAEAYMGTIGDGGQLIILSTSAGASGWFYEQYRAAGPETGITPMFVPWDARPDRDEAWRQRMHTRLGEQGFQREYPATPDEAFTVAEGLVFPQFSIDRHVRSAPVPWEDCLYRYAGYDLGGGDPTAVEAWGVYKDSQGVLRVHCYDLLYKVDGAATVPELYAFLGSWHDRAPFVMVEADPAPGGETVAQSLRAMGLPVRRANNARGDGLSTFSLFLDNDWLTIGDHCEEFIREFSGYRWLTRIDQNSKERFATGTPFDHHADAIDAARYALMGMYTDIWNRPDVDDEPLAYSEIRW